MVGTRHWAVAGLGLALLTSPVVGLGPRGLDPEGSKVLPGKIDLKEKEGGCGSFGTSVEFVDTPKEAATLAKKQEKLVFVLHVSGNFEDPRFT